MGNKLNAITGVGRLLLGLGKSSTGLLMTSLAAYTGWNVLVKGKGFDETAIGIAMGQDTAQKYRDEGGIAVWDRLVNGEKSSNVDNQSGIAQSNGFASSPLQSQQGLPYPSQQEMGGSSLSSSLSGITSILNNFVGGLTGGRLNMMNTFSLILGAYLLLGGKFGWLGKIAGLFLGGIGLKNILNFDQPSQRQMPQQVIPNYSEGNDQPEIENNNLSRSR